MHPLVKNKIDLTKRDGMKCIDFLIEIKHIWKQNCKLKELQSLNEIPGIGFSKNMRWMDAFQQLIINQSSFNGT